MLKLIIAEDEIWIRKSLQKQIDWNGLQLCLAGEAENGIKALKLAEEAQADILLTDIKMPQMDGITLIQRIKKRMPFIKIIIISGYFEYDLIRQAIGSGVVDYIMKPIEENELNGALRKAIVEISLEKEKRMASEEMRSLLNISLPLYRRQCFYEFISGIHHTEEQVKKLIEILDADFLYSGYVVSTMKFSDISTRDVNNRSINDIISKKIEKLIISPHFLLFRSIYRFNEWVFVAGIPLETSSNKQYDMFSQLRNDLIEFMRKDMYIGISQHSSNPLELPKLYRESIQSLSLSFNQSSKISFFDKKRKNGIVNNELDLIRDYIDTHCNEQLTLEGVAKLFYLNPTYLSRIFKANFNDNFKEYLTRKKLESAISLIQSTSFHVETIAEIVGFQSQNYFIKVFRNYFGVTPGEYQRWINKGLIKDNATNY